MTDLATQLGELENRTHRALGTLEQDGRWEEALALYRPARKLRAYLYLREANALRALGREAEAAPLGELELSAAMASGEGLSIARAMFSLGTTCLVNGQ